MQELSDWEVEDLLSSLLSPSVSRDVLGSSSSSILHDHNYSLPQEHVSIDLDTESFEKEGFHVTPLPGEERAAEQVLDLIFFFRITSLCSSQDPPYCSESSMQLCSLHYFLHP